LTELCRENHLFKLHFSRQAQMRQPEQLLRSVVEGDWHSGHG
jgi:hypothetical protein